MINNPFNLQNKKILITGASSGIGKAIAIECSKMGANLVITGRNKENLNYTYSLLSEGEHIILKADLQDENDLSSMINSVPALDGIVHCAGIVNTQPFSFLTSNNLKNTFDVNFFAPVILTQQLLKQKKIHKEASIVFISSIAGSVVTYKGSSAYSASKSAINGIAKTMAIELAPKKIRVNCILPGMIRTELLNNIDATNEDLIEDEKKYPLRGYGSPKDVAFATIYFLSEASRWVTGASLVLDGGFTLQ